MPDIKFEIISAEVKPCSVLPTLSFRMRISNGTAGEEVYAAALKCQVMIEAHKRSYNEASKDRLHELFGKPSRWDETLKTFFWTILNIPVPRFTGETIIEVTIPCSEDQALAAGKYFYAVNEGIIPLVFLFSGSLFYTDPAGNLQVTLVPWEKEASFKMPAHLWQDMMSVYFPGKRWLQVKQETYDRLVAFKARSSFPTLEMALEQLLDKKLQEIEQVQKQPA
jgi:Family of unknown function (DUF6084)